jgi:hypothetical protein
MVSPKPFSMTPAKLQQRIENYLVNNKPRLYKRKKRCGEFQSYLEFTMREVTKTAKNLISRGMFETAAWEYAIYQEISRTENN